MKLSRSPCRIVGIQAGEVSLKVLGPSLSLYAKFALLVEGGETSGFFEKTSAWSDRTQERLQAFLESLEEDALSHVFQQGSEGEIQITTPGQEDDPEPPQI